jgi:hypothetical protein
MSRWPWVQTSISLYQFSRTWLQGFGGHLLVLLWPCLVSPICGTCHLLLVLQKICVPLLGPVFVTFLSRSGSLVPHTSLHKWSPWVHSTFSPLGIFVFTLFFLGCRLYTASNSKLGRSYTNDLKNYMNNHKITTKLIICQPCIFVSMFIADLTPSND